MHVTPATPWAELPEWLTVEQYRVYLQYKSRRAVELQIQRGTIEARHVRGAGRGRRIHKAAVLMAESGEAVSSDAAEGGTVLAHVHSLRR